jgi:tight adherence protein B
VGELISLALAAAGGGALALAARELVRHSPEVVAWVGPALRALSLAGLQGRTPTAAERRRLGLLAGAALGALSLLVLGPGPPALLAAFGPALAARLLGRRQRRYRRGFEAEIPALSAALADSLAAGGSLRTALADVAPTFEGPCGVELRRVCADLDLGASAATALGGLGERLDSGPSRALVAAALSQQRSGGDLAELLRRHAEAEAGRRRALADARAATAQARLTGGMVAAMPVGAALLVELVNPGFVAAMLADPAAALLLAAALGLQLLGYVAIQRLGRVER